MNGRERHGLLVGMALVAFGLIAGCANPGRREREETSYAFQTNLLAETKQVLAETKGTLTLSNAVALAHSRTLKLAEQDLEAKLARINRATAFSAFLPTVAFRGSGTRFSGDARNLPAYDQLSIEGGELNSGMMLVVQPVFTPIAWVMFAESQYGVRIRDIVRARAGELLDMQVAALFYRAAVAARLVRTYELQLESGVALTNRLVRLTAEGYALEADRARAEARLAVDAAALTRARNECAKTRGDLSDLLRLWPLAEFNVKGESILDLPRLPEKTVEEWVWEGLISRKDLYAGDQMVAFRKARVIEALAGFLPNVLLTGGGANLSLEGIMAKGWAGSLTGTWAAFEGFRSVLQYQAARAERETEFQLHEDRMLAVVVAVTESWRKLRAAHEQSAAARAWAEAARLDHAATERRFEGGQETFSTVLDKLAVRDEAEVKSTQAEFAEALAGLLLRQAAGIDLWSDCVCDASAKAEEEK